MDISISALDCRIFLRGAPSRKSGLITSGISWPPDRISIAIADPESCSTMKERLMRGRPPGTIKPFSPDTVFLFIGSDLFYIPNHGHWPVITNNGHVLMSANFDDPRARDHY